MLFGFAPYQPTVLFLEMIAILSHIQKMWDSIAIFTLRCQWFIDAESIQMIHKFMMWRQTVNVLYPINLIWLIPFAQM